MTWPVVHLLPPSPSSPAAWDGTAGPAIRSPPGRAANGPIPSRPHPLSSSAGRGGEGSVGRSRLHLALRRPGAGRRGGARVACAMGKKGRGSSLHHPLPPSPQLSGGLSGTGPWGEERFQHGEGPFLCLPSRVLVPCGVADRPEAKAPRRKRLSVAIDLGHSAPVGLLPWII